MIKIALLILLAIVVAVLAYAATRPDTLRIQRSMLVQAPPGKIHGLINDLPRFNTWNPYNLKDPAIKGTYRGPSAGPGAAYDFEGSRNVGKGSLEIVPPAAPDRVAMRLDMREPMAGSSAIEFTLAPRGEATEVTWSMQGPCPYIARLIGVFVDMDKMMGADFETGLASLKQLAERP